MRKEGRVTTSSYIRIVIVCRILESVVLINTRMLVFPNVCVHTLRLEFYYLHYVQSYVLIHICTHVYVEECILCRLHRRFNYSNQRNHGDQSTGKYLVEPKEETKNLILCVRHWELKHHYEKLN